MDELRAYLCILAAAVVFSVAVAFLIYLEYNVDSSLFFMPHKSILER